MNNISNNSKFNLFHGFVQDSKDALMVIEASKLGHLSLVKRRLDRNNKSLVKPGVCFVWEESSSNISRWTDGRSWSKSRYYKNFFTYYEKKKDVDIGNNEASNLIKRTFTIKGKDNRKFQLVNYLYNSKAENNKLLRPKNSPLNQINIPKDYYYKKDTSDEHNLTANNTNNDAINNEANSISSQCNPQTMTSLSNLNSPLSYLPQENNRLLASTFLLECPVHNTLYSEDKKMVSLFKIEL